MSVNEGNDSKRRITMLDLTIAQIKGSREEGDEEDEKEDFPEAFWMFAGDGAGDTVEDDLEGF